MSVLQYTMSMKLSVANIKVSQADGIVFPPLASSWDMINTSTTPEMCGPLLAISVASGLVDAADNPSKLNVIMSLSGSQAIVNATVNIKGLGTLSPVTIIVEAESMQSAQRQAAEILRRIGEKTAKEYDGYLSHFTSLPMSINWPLWAQEVHKQFTVT